MKNRLIGILCMLSAAALTSCDPYEVDEILFQKVSFLLSSAVVHREKV